MPLLKIIQDFWVSVFSYVNLFYIIFLYHKWKFHLCIPFLWFNYLMTLDSLAWYMLYAYIVTHLSFCINGVMDEFWTCKCLFFPYPDLNSLCFDFVAKSSALCPAIENTRLSRLYEYIASVTEWCLSSSAILYKEHRRTWRIL